MTLVFIVFFVVIPALIFWAIESSWNLVDAFYYVFISLTTIGLGDYIPGDDEEQDYRDFYKLSVAGK